MYSISKTAESYGDALDRAEEDYRAAVLREYTTREALSGAELDFKIKEAQLISRGLPGPNEQVRKAELTLLMAEESEGLREHEGKYRAAQADRAVAETRISLLKQHIILLQIQQIQQAQDTQPQASGLSESERNA